jgi:hypothetical protein
MAACRGKSSCTSSVARSMLDWLRQAENLSGGPCNDAQPVAQPDPQRHATFGPHFILALRRPAVVGRLASTLVIK